MTNKENEITLKELLEEYLESDLSKVMRNMFNGTTNFNIDIGGWDVSNVTDMSNAFRNVSSEVNKPIDTVKPPKTKIVNNLADFDKLFQPSKKKGKLHSKFFKWVSNLVKSRT